jgi:hypothetical protein
LRRFGATLCLRLLKRMQSCAVGDESERILPLPVEVLQPLERTSAARRWPAFAWLLLPCRCAHPRKNQRQRQG